MSHNKRPFGKLTLVHLTAEFWDALSEASSIQFFKKKKCLKDTTVLKARSHKEQEYSFKLKKKKYIYTKIKFRPYRAENVLQFKIEQPGPRGKTRFLWQHFKRLGKREDSKQKS